MKRAFIGAAFLLGLALLVPRAEAQTGSARGRVVDVDGKPIAEAKILIEYLGGVTRKLETKTNKKGEFIQVGMQPGPYRFTVSKEGFQPFTIENRISLGEPTELPEFRLTTLAAAAQQPGSPQAELRQSFQKAVDLSSAGKLDEAEAAYKELLAKWPDIPEIHQNLGGVYRQKKDWASAEASLLKALELRPDSADIAASLATVYQESGRPEKAMEVINKAAVDNPQDAKSQFNRGVYLLNNQQSEEAIKAFEAALAADPGLTEAYYHLGTLMVGQAKIPEAIQYLEKYLSMSPGNAQNVATAKGLLAALKK